VKQLLLNLLAAFGVVPARRYQLLERQATELRNSVQAWKTKAGEALDRARAAEADAKRQVQRLKDARGALAKGAPRDGDVAKLREQLANTERELILAREHLMAIEVKLDILEGAANVLDVRTRTAIRQSTGTGAPV
jgi:hypothetical protein